MAHKHKSTNSPIDFVSFLLWNMEINFPRYALHEIINIANRCVTRYVINCIITLYTAVGSASYFIKCTTRGAYNHTNKDPTSSLAINRNCHYQL